MPGSPTDMLCCMKAKQREMQIHPCGSAINWISKFEFTTAGYIFSVVSVCAACHNTVTLQEGQAPPTIIIVAIIADLIRPYLNSDETV